MPINFFTHERARVEIELRDEAGDVTTLFDRAGGVAWELSNPTSMSVHDNDGEPLDAEIRFDAPTPEGEEATIAVTLDGDPEQGVRTIRLVSADTIVVTDPPQVGAVSGELRVLRMVEEPTA